MGALYNLEMELRIDDSFNKQVCQYHVMKSDETSENRIIDSFDQYIFMINIYLLFQLMKAGKIRREQIVFKIILY